MAFSLNRIEIIGNLGQDAETKFPSDNFSVTNFSVATTHSYKKQGASDWTNVTTWHNVTGFNLGEFYQNNLKKGAKVYVSGRLQKREYTDKEGIKRYAVEIVSEQIIPLDSNNNNAQKEDSDDF